MQLRAGVGVLVVYGHDDGDAARQALQAQERILDASSVGELELYLLGPGALAQRCEQSDADLHEVKAIPELVKGDWKSPDEVSARGRKAPRRYHRG